MLRISISFHRLNQPRPIQKGPSFSNREKRKVLNNTIWSKVTVKMVCDIPNVRYVPITIKYQYWAYKKVI